MPIAFMGARGGGRLHALTRNCTVQVLTNTVTGDVSIGWWKNEERTDDDG